MKNKGKLINYGFRIPTIEISDHIFGAGFGGSIINPSGQWDASKPKYEPQAENFETQGCTVWGTENCIEFLYKFQFGVEKNYEELPPYIGAGIRPESGGDPNRVSQWIRDNGLVEAPKCPFPKTLEELLTLIGKPLTPSIVEDGKKWGYKLRHQWIIEGSANKKQRMDAIKSALPYGIVGASVTAWFKNEKGIYVDNGQRNTHWVVVYGWTDDGWKVFDSYDHSEKIYSFDSVISFAKVYFLEKVITSELKKNWYDGLVAFLNAFLQPKDSQEVIKKLKPVLMPEKTKKELLIETVKSYLGKDASPEDIVTDDVGCADSASAILHQVFPEFPKGIVSTAKLFETLDKSPLFKRTLFPKAGTVIVSPRTTKQTGHAGFVVEKERIISNDSMTGKMADNYSWSSWVKSYKEKRGLHVYLFELA